MIRFVSILGLIFIILVYIFNPESDTILKGDHIGIRHDSLDFSNCLAQWERPEIQTRISQGIELHRKGNAVLLFKNQAGQTVCPSTVQVKQVSHEFLFGTRFLNKEGFQIHYLNEKYERIFLDLFNLAIIPLDIPQDAYAYDIGKGPLLTQKLNHHHTIDSMVVYCQKKDLHMRASPLILSQEQINWDQGSKNNFDLAVRLQNQIEYWDVLKNPFGPGFSDSTNYERIHFSWQRAVHHFTPNTQLGLNASTLSSWISPKFQPDTSLFTMIKEWQKEDLRIDYLGLQFHLWYGRRFIRDIYNGDILRPQDVFKTLDLYGKLGMPLHISEVTIPVVTYEAIGEIWQAILSTKYLRLWFSHPSIESISWWDLTDAFARDGKQYKGALTGDDLRLKPVYHAVRKLIKEEWHTDLVLTPDREKSYEFRGFFGKYNVRYWWNDQWVEATIQLEKGKKPSFTIYVN